jgi:hypothetical protein
MNGQAIDRENEKTAKRFACSIPTETPVLIFDEEKVLVGKSSENCSLGGVDPTVFDTMLTPLAEYFNFGPYRFVTFNGASRYRYLLFHSQKYFILAKLKPGGQSQQVIKEIEGSINRYNMV